MGGTQRVVGLGVAGVGVASLITGGVFASLASSKNKQALEKENCPDSTHCNPSGLTLTDQAKSRALVATVLVIAGAGAAAVGGVIFFTAPQEPPARRDIASTSCLPWTSHRQGEPPPSFGEPLRPKPSTRTSQGGTVAAMRHARPPFVRFSAWISLLACVHMIALATPAFAQQAPLQGPPQAPAKAQSAKPGAKPPQDLIQKGQSQFDEQQYEESVQTLSAALLRPSNTPAQKVEIYRLLALNYITLGRKDAIFSRRPARNGRPRGGRGSRRTSPLRRRSSSSTARRRMSKPTRRSSSAATSTIPTDAPEA